MAAPAFPYPKNSTPGSRPGEGEGRYWNCAPQIEGERSYVRPTPGLARQVSMGQAGIRGMLDVNGVLYVVWTGSVVTVSGGVPMVLTGSIPGSDGVTLARNNKVTGGVSTPDIVAVREGGGAYVLTASAVSAYPDADLPAAVNSVDFLGGYFLFSVPEGRIFASELNSTDINALSFTTAESRADGLRRIVVQGSQAYAMGTSTIEPYQNVGTSLFPLQRAATVPPVGILTTMAVAGYQEAWGGAIYFVASDKTVKSLSGYDTAKISTADVNRFIGASTPSTIDVTAFVWEGRSYVAVSSDHGSWIFDIAESAWHERGSTGASRWRAKYSACSGEQWVFGDVLTGDLLVMTAAQTENGSPIGGFVQSGQLKDFPAHVAAKLSADFTKAAVTIFVSWSHDGGQTWSIELPRPLANADRWPVEVASLGRSTHHGIIVKFRWEAAAPFSFMGASALRADKRQG